MTLEPIATTVERAVRTAAEIRSDALDMRARTGLQIGELAAFANRLQSRFERIKPVLGFTPAEVQAAAGTLYGSRAPADALALIGVAQAAGAAVVQAIAESPHDPAAAPAWAWDAASATYQPRAIAGADLAFLAAPLDGLVAALDEVAGG